MLSISLRITKKKLAALGVAAVLLGTGAVFAANSTGAGTASPESAQAMSVTQATLKTDEERVNYLRQFGWEVSAEPIEVKEVLIPQEFDAVMEQYNAVQKQQGLDLLRCRGKTVRRYTYAVSNYPDKPDYVRADLFLYRDKVVGADICSTQLDGFLHGLEMPKQTQGES